MLKLRLKRVGRKHDPSFRIVVAENTKSSQGGYLESVGFYNAMLKQLHIKKDRASYWLGVGAQPTDVVHNLLVREKVIDAPKIAVHKKSKKQTTEEKAPVAEENKAEQQKQEQENEETQEEQKDATTKQSKDAQEKQEAVQPENEKEAVKEESKAENKEQETAEQKPESKNESSSSDNAKQNESTPEQEPSKE